MGMAPCACSHGAARISPSLPLPVHAHGLSYCLPACLRRAPQPRSPALGSGAGFGLNAQRCPRGPSPWTAGRDDGARTRAGLHGFDTLTRPRININREQGPLFHALQLSSVPRRRKPSLRLLSGDRRGRGAGFAWSLTNLQSLLSCDKDRKVTTNTAALFTSLFFRESKFRSQSGQHRPDYLPFLPLLLL
jgi:hypothetical protein